MWKSEVIPHSEVVPHSASTPVSAQTSVLTVQIAFPKNSSVSAEFTSSPAFLPTTLQEQWQDLNKRCFCQVNFGKLNVLEVLHSFMFYSETKQLFPETK